MCQAWGHGDRKRGFIRIGISLGENQDSQELLFAGQSVCIGCANNGPPFLLQRFGGVFRDKFVARAFSVPNVRDELQFRRQRRNPEAVSLAPQTPLLEDDP